jgi:predicted aminopeptidase
MPRANRSNRKPPPTDRSARARSKIFSLSRSTLPIFATLCCLFSGCDFAYIARGGYEGARLLWNRKPISTELTTADLSDDVRGKLETILRVREFARDRLGLNVGGAYESVTNVDSGAITWVVMAAPRDSLKPYEWWFPIVGSVPYRGYFSKPDAESEARALEGEGYDTYVRAAVAFSSLGWFDDPVLSNMLKLDRVELAGVIVHELFHRTYFAPGQVMFNESAANYIGDRGAVDFFTATEGANSTAAKDARAALDSNLRFAEFLLQAEAQLLRLYNSGLPADEILSRRPAAFQKIQSDYARLKPQLSGLSRFDLDQQPLNNAVFLSYRIYFHDLSDFAALENLHRGDTRATITTIISLAKSNPSDPFYGIWQAAYRD